MSEPNKHRWKSTAVLLDLVGVDAKHVKIEVRCTKNFEAVLARRSFRSWPAIYRLVFQRGNTLLDARNSGWRVEAQRALDAFPNHRVLSLPENPQAAIVELRHRLLRPRSPR